MTAPLSTMSLSSGDVELRRAELEDRHAIGGWLTNDSLGRARETGTEGADLKPVRDAGRAGPTHPAQPPSRPQHAPHVVGTMQLSFIPRYALSTVTR